MPKYSSEHVGRGIERGGRREELTGTINEPAQSSLAVQEPQAPDVERGVWKRRADGINEQERESYYQPK
jgi:hypothetical protein